MEKTDTVNQKRKRDSENGASEIQLYATKGAPIQIQFATNFAGKDYRLMEVTEDILEEVLNEDAQGRSLKLIGDRKGDAVLCSNNKTFSVKKVETSNSVFLVPPSDSNTFKIESRISFYYELKVIPGRVEELKALLEPSQYNGSNDSSDPSKHLSLDDIERSVQASKKEISAALNALGVVELNGKMRMVSKYASIDITTTILDTIIENNWNIESIDEQALLQQLPGDSGRIIVRHVLSQLGTEIDNTSTSSSITSSTWKLDKRKLLRASAHLVFTSTDTLKVYGDQKVPVEDFLERWAIKSPGVGSAEDLATLVEEHALLKGIAIKEEMDTALGKGKNTQEIAPSSSSSSRVRGYYHYLPREGMSMSPVDRFGKLFAVKTGYKFDEIEPYIEDLVDHKSKDFAMAKLEFLLKHVRLVDGSYYAK